MIGLAGADEGERKEHKPGKGDGDRELLVPHQPARVAAGGCEGEDGYTGGANRLDE